MFLFTKILKPGLIEKLSKLKANVIGIGEKIGSKGSNTLNDC
jgi:hypothetical protein